MTLESFSPLETIVSGWAGLPADAVAHRSLREISAPDDIIRNAISETHRLRRCSSGKREISCLRVRFLNRNSKPNDGAGQQFQPGF